MPLPKLMIEVKDQMNFTIRLGKLPERIVSLVPSQTELLYDLGLEDRVVGITKFCIYPEVWFRNKNRVGGTKNVDFEKLKALKPDLIIANKEENAQADIEALQKLYPVYVSDIFNEEEACTMIEDVGKLTGTIKEASSIVEKVKKDFEEFPKINAKVLYFIWSNPYMVVGANTFIGHLINKLGMTNCIVEQKERYIEISKEEIVQLEPACLLLSSEPFPFSEKHIEEFKTFYKGDIMLVDGELFSWYGSRMLKMKQYFEELAKKF